MKTVSTYNICYFHIYVLIQFFSMKGQNGTIHSDNRECSIFYQDVALQLRGFTLSENLVRLF